MFFPEVYDVFRTIVIFLCSSFSSVLFYVSTVSPAGFSYGQKIGTIISLALSLSPLEKFFPFTTPLNFRSFLWFKCLRTNTRIDWKKSRFTYQTGDGVVYPNNSLVACGIHIMQTTTMSNTEYGLFPKFSMLHFKIFPGSHMYNDMINRKWNTPLS